MFYKEKMMNNQNNGLKPAGYLALAEKYEINNYNHWHKSYIAYSGMRKVKTVSGVVEEVFTRKYMPQDNDCGHLEFALKYDGYNLFILKRVFSGMKEEELTAFIKSKPLSKYGRKLWFLYEFLMDKKLDIEDLRQGNYEYFLEQNKYYTGRARKSKRHKIYNNMLGNDKFCPIVRRTETLAEYDKKDLSERSRELLSEYNDELLHRASAFLYSKETKSSYKIEHIDAKISKIERFSRLLQKASEMDYCNKEGFIEIQNSLVDSRYEEKDYRTEQNYIGETIHAGREKIHYICPQPEDIDMLMEGLIDLHKNISESKTSPIVHAAVISYGFVFIHPFEDGNGRLHRFLIHNLLSQRHFTPEHIVFPVSAVMLKERKEYDRSLEIFSHWIMINLEYSLDEYGKMTVLGDTLDYYRFIDLTFQAEALYKFIEKTIYQELIDELNYLRKYDAAKSAIQKIVDMPDKKIDLFIKFFNQGHGSISDKKADKYFSKITIDERKRMEKALSEIYLM